MISMETQRAHARLVYICDWLPPEFGAVGQYSLHFARQRARNGISVALYGLSSTTASTDIEQFPDAYLKIVRIKAGAYDKTSFHSRAWWTIRTNFRLIGRALQDIRKGREVLFTGSPPFLLHFLAPLNLFLRKKLTYRITDFFPECLIAGRKHTPLLLKLLYRLTLFWRRQVSQFEVLGEDQRRRLLEIGIEEDRIALRRDPCPVEISPATRPSPRPAALASFRILLYSGNFGVAHDHETFLAGYKKHHRGGNARVALWLNASGAGAQALENDLLREGLPFHRTQPVPLEQLAGVLIATDAHLITLRNPFAGFVLPSKVYGCVESGKDILFIGPEDSDVHLLCSTRQASGRYFRADVGDADQVFRILETLGIG